MPTNSDSDIYYTVYTPSRVCNSDNDVFVILVTKSLNANLMIGYVNLMIGYANLMCCSLTSKVSFVCGKHDKTDKIPYTDVCCHMSAIISGRCDRLCTRM